ncbi:unnamed protein product [Toxocara canis]|uniref:Uncharacterized protein n=1 Tax=Toxocara canis TaxID=6265 RepID=A0A3P7GZ45_TOXCA|nr:unnamed protein product [Toxocara canis]
MSTLGSSSWSSKATKIFEALTTGRVVDAFVVGYDVDDMTPVVELFCSSENDMAILLQLVRVDRVLLEAGVAKPADLSKVMQVLPKPIFIDGLGVPLPLHANMSTATSV